MPCCGTTTRVEELTDAVGCETCNVVLELGDTRAESCPSLPDGFAARPAGSGR